MTKMSKPLYVTSPSPVAPSPCSSTKRYWVLQVCCLGKKAEKMPLKCLKTPISAEFAFAIPSYNHHFYKFPTVVDTGAQQWPPSFILIQRSKTGRLSRSFLRASSSPSPSSSPELEGNNKVAMAKEALCQYLHLEVGILMENALGIVSNSTEYVDMLIESVDELEQISGFFNEQRGLASTSFMEKVCEMAKQKGDNGMIPYLESVGLPLSSASHIARYLAAHSLQLADLMLKVKYVKEIFFSDSDDEGLVGRNAKRMMTCLSISVDDDLQQTLSFFEKIQARRGGLDLLGSKDASLRYLIESFPRLLLLSTEASVNPVIKILEEIGVPEGCLGQLLLLFPPLMFYDVQKDILPKLEALKKVTADNNDFGRTVLKYPWIFSKSILRNYEKILRLFNEEKVPEENIVSAIRDWPYLLGCSVDKLKVTLLQFIQLDIRNKKLGRVIARSPQLLLQKPQEFFQVILFFKGLGLDEESIARIFARCPEIFTSSVEKTLKRKLHFLLSIGVSATHLPRVVKKYPEFFVCDVDRSLLPRMRYLNRIGLSKKEVSFMVRRFSPLLGYSIEQVLKPKLEFLIGTMKKPLSEVVEYPRYFSYSLEKKIKPRYCMLSGQNKDCSLKDMLSKNDEEFAADFMDF